MRFSELTRQREVGVLALTGLQDADLSDPQYDSRAVKPGSTFFAIKGFQTDGHRFIADAIARGATVIVLEDADAFSEADAASANVSRLLVSSARKALAIISEEAFGSPSQKLRLIGVTGTNGKTTTTNVIRQFLELRGEKVGLIGTLGAYIGSESLGGTLTTPESRDLSAMLRQMVDSGVTTCVMEVSSIAVELERTAALDFDIAVFTNLTQDHLDFHKTMEAYASAKQKLFTGLKPNAVAITNADDEYGAFMIENTSANAHSYGQHDGSRFGSADILASNVEYSLRGTSFNVAKRYSDEEAVIASQLVGEFNVENMLAAISALYFGVEGCTLSVLAELSSQIRPVHGRFEQIELPGDSVAIVDYAHTPDALENVLKTIRSLAPHSTVTTIFGCGGDRDRTKRPLMGAIAERYSDEVIVTNDNPRTEDPKAIADEILTGFRSPKKAVVVLDRAQAIRRAILSSQGDSVILIAGKGHEDYQIVGKEKRHFDDREQVLEVREMLSPMSLRGGQ
ncbi:MAG: UDP-N-acetylmuramoyl-L-alanyl-D-glutamate--2,6-diaminopimelate ligase [Bacteroidetes bacterium]|nr:UDP-N-acetylmuramoyl-L-alanyl-D-glutamate--2,6-diaminopimelate ligase [Bacteroidota bacterium]